MTGKHEIPTTIGSIDTEENIIKLCWWCPSTVDKNINIMECVLDIK